MRIDSIKSGDVLSSMVNEGSGRVTTVFYRVLKCGKVKVRVRSEYGVEGWMYPQFFDSVCHPHEVEDIEWK